jgi:4-amino-4-deoxy-L-arabinose transferase-like glycosyltransferase
MKKPGTVAEIQSPSAITVQRWLLLILGLGLFLRLWNLDYPVWKQPDEQNIVDRALLLGHSGLNPGWFAYPSLFLYVLFAADAAFYAGGSLLGIFTSPEQFAAFYFSHPLLFHLIARGLILACGMASLVVVFRIGCAGWGPGVGLAAAGILAVSPVWVDFSRLAKQDMLMVLLLLVAAYGVLRSLEEEGRGWLWTAGVAVGLAASTKYTAGMGVAWLLLAAWIRRRGRAALVEGVGALGLAALAFVAGTPYAVLDWSTFRSNFTSMANLMHGTWYGAEDRQGYTFYLFRAFPWALGWPGTFLGILGCEIGRAHV